MMMTVGVGTLWRVLEFSACLFTVAKVTVVQSVHSFTSKPQTELRLEGRE